MATQGSHPGTPIRATVSSLSLRSAPSVPPASHTYEPLVRSVLRHRLLYVIFPYSAAFTWLVSVWTTTWMRGGLPVLGLVGALVRNPLSPVVLGVSALAWCFGVLPVLVLRKTYMTVTPTPAKCPAEIFAHARRKKSTTHALLVYLSSPIVFTTLHVVLANTYEDDPRLSLFVKSRKHPYYLNGRLLYLFFTQLVLALTYLTRSILLDRFTIRLSLSSLSSSSSLSSHSPHKQQYLLAKLLTSLTSLLLLTTLSLFLSTTLFTLTRSLILPIIFKLPLVSRVVKPFMAHFARGGVLPLGRNLGVVGRAWAVGMGMGLGWEVAEGLFEGVVAQPIKVSHLTPDPTLTTISGLTSSSAHVKLLAYAELCSFATSDSPQADQRANSSATNSNSQISTPRTSTSQTSTSTSIAAQQRATLFNDQKYNPTIWSTFVRETLLMLGREYQLFVSRGQVVPSSSSSGVGSANVGGSVGAGATSTAAGSGNRKKELPPNVHPTPLPRRSILKSSTTSNAYTNGSPIGKALETLAADGVVSGVVAEVVEGAVEGAEKKMESLGNLGLPELFRSVLHSPSSSSTPSAGASVSNGASAGGVQKVVDTVKKGQEEVKNVVTQVSNSSSLPLPLLTIYKTTLLNIYQTYIPTSLRQTTISTTLKEVSTESKDWWKRERVHKVAEGMVRGGVGVVLGVEGMCFFCGFGVFGDVLGGFRVFARVVFGRFLFSVFSRFLFAVLLACVLRFSLRDYFARFTRGFFAFFEFLSVRLCCVCSFIRPFYAFSFRAFSFFFFFCCFLCVFRSFIRAFVRLILRVFVRSFVLRGCFTALRLRHCVCLFASARFDSLRRSFCASSRFSFALSTRSLLSFYAISSVDGVDPTRGKNVQGFRARLILLSPSHLVAAHEHEEPKKNHKRPNKKKKKLDAVLLPCSFHSVIPSRAYVRGPKPGSNPSFLPHVVSRFSFLPAQLVPSG
ncbi:hypothetical protein K474DRAFT_744568 [Panus rudis PR-1116 ss-1]|nr:hypothetical protein K474DRAFT_744568 [Panus rudis PR-1116 ss-1]